MMVRKLGVSLLLGMISCLSGCMMLQTKDAAGEGGRPSLRALQTSIAPVIDGRVNDACWNERNVTSTFRTIASLQPTTFATKAWVAYDRRNLYIGFRCPTGEEKPIAKTFLHDGSVWEDDSFELYLQTDVDTGDYYHFIVNWRGVTFDARNRETTWTPYYVVRTTRYKNGWQGELAIPWDELILPVNHDGVRINFARNVRPSGELSSWTGNRSSYHETDRFGELEGLRLDRARLAQIRVRRELERLEKEFGFLLPEEAEQNEDENVRALGTVQRGVANLQNHLKVGAPAREGTLTGKVDPSSVYFGTLRSYRRPARVGLEAILPFIPEYVQIQKELLRNKDVKYHLLKARGDGRFARAIQNAAEGLGYDLVVDEEISGAGTLPDLTPAVLEILSADEE